MTQDPDQAVRRIADRIVDLDIGNYLVSERFSRFCRVYDISDIWDGLLRSSGDKPDLYGNETIRHAFFLLLVHLYRNRKADFPQILTGLIAESIKKPVDPSFVPAIRMDLIQLGYSPEDTKKHVRGSPRQKSRRT